MKRLASTLSVLWLLLSPGHCAIERVLLISMDGLRGDFLQLGVEMAPAEFPNFTRMRALGACTYNARSCHTWSFTVGNHLGMVTGRPSAQAMGLPNTAHHGFLLNDPPAEYSVHTHGNPAVPYKYSIYDVVHDRGFSTAGYFNKLKFTSITTSYDAQHGAPDLVPPDNGRAKLDIAPPPGPAYVSNLLTEIRATRMKHFTMLHMVDMDYAGHSFSWSMAPDSAYRNTLRSIDAQFGEILDAILTNPAYATKTAIIVVADHGGGAPGDLYSHSNPAAVNAVTIPFLLLAPGITGGTDAHEWFENRFDPGIAIPSYLAPSQPMRNLDAANVVASLMGVPAVPGSIARPIMKRKVIATKAETGVKVAWPLYLTGHTLEYCDDFSQGEWITVSTGIQEVGDQWVYMDSQVGATRRFFRLRSP